MQNKIFPVLVFSVVFMVALDVLNQRAVTITEILPALVVIRLAIHSKINAERGLVVPAACITVFFPFRMLGCVQFFKNAVCYGQRHGFAVLQLVAFAPKNCDRTAPQGRQLLIAVFFVLHSSFPLAATADKRT